MNPLIDWLQSKNVWRLIKIRHKLDLSQIPSTKYQITARTYLIKNDHKHNSINY